MSREVEISAYDRESEIFDKERLLVPENLLKRRLEFLRAEYSRLAAPRRPYPVTEAQEAREGEPR